MPPATVHVRYWAAARAATGVDRESVTVGDACASVGDVLDEVSGRHTGLARVLAVASVLVDGRVADQECALTEGMVIEVLPPFAGG